MWNERRNVDSEKNILRIFSGRKTRKRKTYGNMKRPVPEDRVGVETD
jgi:hypothetical protein